METRFARPDEVEEIAALWCDAFPGKRTIADRVRMLETGGPYGGIETVLVARDRNGRLAGACKLYRMTQHLAGAALPMMGLAAVAVAPYARRRGLGAALCGAAIHEARSRGDVLSTLYPFRPSYYERLGWGLAGRLLRYRFRTDALPPYEEARHVRPARFPDDAEAIAGCYARVAARSNGPIRRDRRIWAYRLAGQELGVRPIAEEAVLAGRGPRKHRLAVFDRDGVAGYAILRPARARAPEEAMMQVRELIAEGEAAYRGLMGHLAAQRDQWPLGLHYARPDERFGDRLGDPRPPGYTPSRSLYFPTARVVQGPMLRVLDVAAALRARPLGSGAGESGAVLLVTVSDAHIAANQGPWRVVVGAGPAAGGTASPSGPEDRGPAEATNVVEPAGEGAASDASLETDAPTLARVLAGEVAPSVAARLGRARVGGRVELLDRAFAAAESFWLLDEF